MNFKVDFIGIGVPKAATTYIARCLSEHPEVDFAKEKDTNYFLSDEFISKYYGTVFKCTSLQEYEGQFSNVKKLRGEFSVNYLLDYSSAKKVKAVFPEVKLLVSFRNPVESIYSAYWYFKAMGKISSGSFEEAIKSSSILDAHLYLYGKSLENYMSFFDKNQFFFTTHDEISAKPEETVKQLYKFIGVNANFTPPSLYVKVNPTDMPRNEAFNYLLRKCVKKLPIKPGNPMLAKLYKPYKLLNVQSGQYPKMHTRTKEELRNIFKEDILLLQRLVQKDLSRWLND